MGETLVGLADVSQAGVVQQDLLQDEGRDLKGEQELWDEVRKTQLNDPNVSKFISEGLGTAKF